MSEPVDIYRLTRQYETGFDPVQYADLCCRMDTNKTDQAHIQLQQSILVQQFKLFNKDKICGSRLLEIGSGPTIHNVIEPALYFEHVYLSEYVECSRTLLKAWINDKEDAPDFRNVFEYTASLHENQLNAADLETNLRSKIRDVIFCDIFLENPLEPQNLEPFDCVISSAVLESTCTDFGSFQRCIENVTNLLKPGGRFITNCFINDVKYNIGTVTMETLPLTSKEIKTAVENAGLNIESYDEKLFDDTEQNVLKDANEFLAGHCLIHAVKPINRGN